MGMKGLIHEHKFITNWSSGHFSFLPSHKKLTFWPGQLWTFPANCLRQLGYSSSSTFIIVSIIVKAL